MNIFSRDYTRSLLKTLNSELQSAPIGAEALAIKTGLVSADASPAERLQAATVVRVAVRALCPDVQASPGRFGGFYRNDTPRQQTVQEPSKAAPKEFNTKLIARALKIIQEHGTEKPISCERVVKKLRIKNTVKGYREVRELYQAGLLSGVSVQRGQGGGFVYSGATESVCDDEAPTLPPPPCAEEMNAIAAVA